MTATELYDATCYDAARRLTLRYSNSFGLASRLFAHTVRPHVYAVYGMVRIADEIVDTYSGSDKADILAAFQADVHASLRSGYSTNPIIHAFGLTAKKMDIGRELIDPFFKSMAMDLTAHSFTTDEYANYIYGSAEVVGLMCLKIFCDGNNSQYDSFAPGARALGSAYQKVNFLRDFGADYDERGRIYFPDTTINTWTDSKKDSIIQDIGSEYKTARSYIKRLPRSARTSVYLSYLYYDALLKRLSRMSAQDIRKTRAHVPSIEKLALFVAAPFGARL